jgi:oxygen-independent coproporphyrinogen-3 oxidase
MIPGLYIHIPFCLSKCGYCNFYSETSLRSIPAYIEALGREMEIYRPVFHEFDTVYVGGGTPSVLKPHEIGDILQAIEHNFSLSGDAEITMEVNPGDVSPDFLTSLRKQGINRITIGVQSFYDSVLDFLGRRHSSYDAVKAIEWSQEAGFTNIGLDLIYGVPGQTIDSWDNTITRAISFRPEHLSCYQLTIEADTPLGIRLGKGAITLPDEDLQYDFFMSTAETLKGEGYIHYEISNYAREPRFASHHNSKYWDHTPYLGLGPSAHSLLDNKRWWNHPSIERYLADIETGKPPVEDNEHLDTEDMRMEAFFLGLRTAKGINLQDFKDRFDYDLVAEKRDMLARLAESGLIQIADGFVVPTRRGFALADSLALI